MNDLAADVLLFLSAPEKRELGMFLEGNLDSFTSSELKGMLNRASREIRFTSAGAKAFLDAVLIELQSR